MKKNLLFVLVGLFVSQLSLAQTHSPGPVEQKVTNAICDCLNKIDQSKITTSKEAKDAFMNCYMAQSDKLIDLTNERNISVGDGVAMHQLGIDIGKNLLSQKCNGFTLIAVKMADKKGEPEAQTTTGIFKRIDNKGFNYIIIADENGSEKSFLWLRQFGGSEQFINNASASVGKKITISWQDMEVYLPQSKGYFAIKEITAISVP
jgi:hypothetical protein